MSCPRATTRTAFTRLAVDAVSHADRSGDQAACFCRSLINLLAEERPGAARWASPGGLKHLAEVTAAAAGAHAPCPTPEVLAGTGECRRVLAAGNAVPLLLTCLKTRCAHETASHSNLPAQQQQKLLQEVEGFGAVVRAIGRLLAVGDGAAAAGLEGMHEALREEGAISAVTERQFLLAAVQAFPREAGDILVNLVWRGGGRGPSEAAEEGALGSSAIADLRPHAVEIEEARGILERGGGGGGTGSGAGGGGEETSSVASAATSEWGPVWGGKGGEREDVNDRALNVLLDIVEDLSRSAHHVGAAMDVLSRVLHLRDGHARKRLEAALGTLGASVDKASDRDAGAKEGPSRGGGGGPGAGGPRVYLTGKLIASLFVHVPEVRPVLRAGTWSSSSSSASLLGTARGIQ